MNSLLCQGEYHYYNIIILQFVVCNTNGPYRHSHHGTSSISPPFNNNNNNHSDFFAAMSKGEYTTSDIETMEFTILNTLSWRIYAPTSIQMAHSILSLIVPHVSNILSEENNTWGFILDEVQYQTECAVRDYTLCTQRPSTVVMAALFNTINMVSDRDERKVLLHALLLVMNNQGKFASLELILGTRHRLRQYDTTNTTSSTVPSQDDSTQDYDQEENDSIYTQDASMSIHSAGSDVSEVSMRSIDRSSKSSRSSEHSAIGVMEVPNI